QIQVECLHDFHDGGKLRVPIRAQRLVKALARQPGCFRDGGHAARLGDVAKGSSDEGRIPVLESGVHVGEDSFLAIQVFRSVPSLCFNSHDGHSYISRARAIASTISAFWLLLSPPPRRIATALPRLTK